MENTQIIEPAFRIVAVSSRNRNAGGRRLSLLLIAGLVKKAFFAVLDRVGICHAPRVLSAECLAAELPGAVR